MSLNDYERTIVDNVAKYGWHCSHVFDPDRNQPDFSYTVGLWETLCVPELIVIGLGRELMHSMLWEMYRQLKAGAQLADGARWSGLIEGFECVSRKVHPTQIGSDYFNSARWYHRFRSGGGALEAYQIFWPGAQQGLFPWEAGCVADVREWQPPLYLPDEQGLA